MPRRFLIRSITGCWISVIAACGLAVMAAPMADPSPASASTALSGDERATNGPAPARMQIQAQPRTDPNSRLAHEELLRKAAQGGIDVYFEGDSITRRWGTSDRQYQDFLAHWNSNFHGWNAGNFGWGGDTVQNILWRLENGELNEVNPKVIVLMAGTNNLRDTPDAKDRAAQEEEVVLGIEAILTLMRQKSPRSTIILMGITPRNDGTHSASWAATIDRINHRIARFADGNQTRFLNINDKLAGSDGQLCEGVTVDGLHLSIKGYQIWADALKPMLTELLGPPAKMDRAPAPTGDPSAKKPR